MEMEGGPEPKSQEPGTLTLPMKDEHRAKPMEAAAAPGIQDEQSRPEEAVPESAQPLGTSGEQRSTGAEEHQARQETVEQAMDDEQQQAGCSHWIGHENWKAI